MRINTTHTKKDLDFIMTTLYECRQKDKTTWDVVENQTQQVVYRSNDRNAAFKKSKFWNRGGGFFGWTPYFIVIGRYK